MLQELVGLSNRPSRQSELLEQALYGFRGAVVPRMVGVHLEGLTLTLTADIVRRTGEFYQQMGNDYSIDACYSAAVNGEMVKVLDMKGSYKYSSGKNLNMLFVAGATGPEWRGIDLTFERERKGKGRLIPTKMYVLCRPREASLGASTQDSHVSVTHTVENVIHSASGRRAGSLIELMHEPDERFPYTVRAEGGLLVVNGHVDGKYCLHPFEYAVPSKIAMEYYDLQQSVEEIVAQK